MSTNTRSMKTPTYDITLRSTAAWDSTMRGSGLDDRPTCLRYDGDQFREGMFDARQWDEEQDARDAFNQLAEDGPFAPGLEMVLTRTVYDAAEDDVETETILIRELVG